MFGLGKKPTQKDLQVQEIIELPVNLNVAHSYAAPDPAHNDYPSKLPYGTAVYATQEGTELPSIQNQDAILVHYFQPPAAQNPDAWYADRNEQINFLHQQEKTVGVNWQDDKHDTKDSMAPNPWLSTPLSNRVTSTQSPSDYRFVRPFDQRFSRTLLGNSGSLATIDKQYAYGGMQPANQWRNTLRLSPTRWDIEQFDASAASIPAVTSGVYVDPYSQQVAIDAQFGIR